MPNTQVRTDTIYGFKRNYDYSYGLGTSTTVYGMYQMKNTNSRVQAVRHKITTSMGFSYRPDFGRERYGFWDSYVDADGRIHYYDRFAGALFGSTGRGASGAISFSMSHNVEAKVLNLNDTTATAKEKYRKVKIIDNLGLSTSYNLIADSLNMSPISVRLRTTLRGFNLNVNGTLDPYMANENGVRYHSYMWNHARGLGKIGRLTNASTSFGMSFSSKQGQKEAEENRQLIDEENILPGSYVQYQDFNIPWDFRFDYSVAYSRPNPHRKATLMQSLNFSGRVSLTDKWRANMNTNFDIQAMKFSFTTFNVSRDLHCFNMQFNFVPFGARKSYSFTLSASSTLLRDLKINKQRSWFDQ